MNFKKNQVVEYVGDEYVDCTKSGLERTQPSFNTGDVVWYDGKDPDVNCLPAGQFTYFGDSYFENCAVVSNGNGCFYHVLKENLK